MYLFDGQVLVQGFPKPLTYLGLPDTLKHVDAAMIWGHNKQTYLFSGSAYWCLDEKDGQVVKDYPRNIKEVWKGVDYNIDAAFRWSDGNSIHTIVGIQILFSRVYLKQIIFTGATYFFKGKGFWKFNDKMMRVTEPKQTLSASKWMGCPQSSEKPENFSSLPDEGLSSGLLIIVVMAAAVIGVVTVVVVRSSFIRKKTHSYSKAKILGV